MSGLGLRSKGEGLEAEEGMGRTGIRSSAMYCTAAAGAPSCEGL